MIVLALGTNLGNKLENLQNAVSALSNGILSNIKTSIIYETEALVPEGAPQSWNIPYYNMVLSGQTHLDPHNLLKAIKEIEKTLGRIPSERWAPRLIDIDILLYNDVQISTESLTIPHQALLIRPFVMLPLYTLLPHVIIPGTDLSVEAHIGDFKKYIGSFTRTFALTPKVVGIVNVTPDSFSDGGKFFNAEKAIKHAIDLVDSGASIIDFGAQSTWAKANVISASEEIERLSPVIDGFMKEMHLAGKSTRISIDTFHPEVISALLKQHRIDIINDVSAASNPKLLEIAAAENLKYVLMHSVDVPTHLQNLIPFDVPASETLLKWAQDKILKLHKFGISQENIIFDPGIGFDKSPSQNFEILQRLKDLKELGVEILIGHSRKYYHNTFCVQPAENRDLETAVISSHISDDVDYLRVHNVALTHRSIVAKLAVIQ